MGGFAAPTGRTRLSHERNGSFRGPVLTLTVSFLQETAQPAAHQVARLLDGADSHLDCILGADAVPGHEADTDTGDAVLLPHSHHQDRHTLATHAAMLAWVTSSEHHPSCTSASSPGPGATPSSSLSRAR